MMSSTIRDVREQENDGDIAPRALKRGQRGRKCLFHKSVMGNFMVYQDRFETNLLQIFAQQENSQWFSIISASIFEVNVVAEQK